MYSYGPPHMAKQKQDDQLELTYSSYVRTQDVTLKTCQRRWIIGRSGDRGSGISVLVARHDDDDDIVTVKKIIGFFILDQHFSLRSECSVYIVSIGSVSYSLIHLPRIRVYYTQKNPTVILKLQDIRYMVHSISLQTVFVQAFKIIIDSWTFSMLLLYILWDDWPIFMISGSNQQQELEYILLKPDWHSWWISKMQSYIDEPLPHQEKNTKKPKDSYYFKEYRI